MLLSEELPNVNQAIRSVFGDGELCEAPDEVCKVLVALIAQGNKLTPARLQSNDLTLEKASSQLAAEVKRAGGDGATLAASAYAWGLLNLLGAQLAVLAVDTKFFKKGGGSGGVGENRTNSRIQAQVPPTKLNSVNLNSHPQPTNQPAPPQPNLDTHSHPYPYPPDLIWLVVQDGIAPLLEHLGTEKASHMLDTRGDETGMAIHVVIKAFEGGHEARVDLSEEFTDGGRATGKRLYKSCQAVARSEAVPPRTKE